MLFLWRFQAVQVSKIAKELGKGGSKKRKANPVTVRRLVGRLTPKTTSTLKHQPSHILVGTPKSLQTALDEGFISTKDIFACVFDEVDHLVQDFSQAAMVEFMRPRDKVSPWQLIFVTASVTPAVEKVAEKFMAKPFLNTRVGLVVHRDAAGLLSFGENPADATLLAIIKPRRAGEADGTLGAAVPQNEEANDDKDEDFSKDDEDDEDDEVAEDGELDHDDSTVDGEPQADGGGELVVRRKTSRLHEYSNLSLANPATRPEPDLAMLADVEQNMPTVTHQLLIHNGDNLAEKITLFRRWYNAAKPAQLLVFVRDNTTAVRLANNLRENRFSVMQLLNDTHKDIRHTAIRRLTRRNLRVLITTDMGSRGLHFPQLTHVVNFDGVDTPLQYIHHAGRVGRLNGRKDNPGVVTLCNQEEAMLLWQFGNELNIKLEPVTVIQHSILYENPPPQAQVQVQEASSTASVD